MCAKGVAFMLSVLAVFARLTFRKQKKKFVLLYWFIFTPNTGTKHSRSDKMHHWPVAGSYALFAS
jgi:hypothetical protein